MCNGMGLLIALTVLSIALSGGLIGAAIWENDQSKFIYKSLMDCRKQLRCLEEAMGYELQWHDEGYRAVKKKR